MARIGSLVLLFSLILASSNLVMAAKNLSISQIRKNLRSQARVLKRINKKIIKLESRLGHQNKGYINILENKRQIESQIYKNSEKITKYLELVALEKNRVKKLLGSVVANLMSNEETSADILSKKIMSRALSQELVKLKSFEDILKIKKMKLEEVQKYFNSLEVKETEILTLINELENRKKEYASEYVKVEKKKSELSGKLSSVKSSLSFKKRKKKSIEKILVRYRFKSPIEKYSGLEYRKKGITFKFNNKQTVKNTINGKVSYVGSLSNYGKVIMIDHGNQTRSIFLGDVETRVRQGQAVKSGQIIGYTHVKSNSSELSKLYFEVRKNNKAQNTFLLMDKKFLAKNNLNSVNL
ncbi:hypothetical protein A9Q84_08480 [Halobacteriovorax marinus]|uniref:M23ase beta-sheet core domain-containing protein n=1 Tax=Halobacteriovorax marinus TaxID=97084 RepID=A0A1Y5F658_9BACT|nr:hypothetical protein A9Q84_08480 [Halobacteriovorax marinus]